MIEHRDVPSTHIVPAKDLILVRPRELPKGEVIEGGFVIEMEQNTSVVDRPTLGTIIAIGSDIETFKVNDIVLWVSQDGVDVLLEDGAFMFLQQKSILGTIK